MEVIEWTHHGVSIVEVDVRMGHPLLESWNVLLVVLDLPWEEETTVVRLNWLSRSRVEQSHF